MSNRNLFTIGTPCHEDWQQMTPVEQGRFCDACAKCVVDLSGKSQPEIKSLYEQHEGNLCGSMPLSQYKQLEKAKTTPSQPSFVRSRWSTLQIFAASFIAAFGLLWNSTVQAQSHRNYPVRGKIKAVPTTATLKGRVLLEGEGKAGVYVTITGKGGTFSAETDADGYFGFYRLQPGKWEVIAYHEASLSEAWTMVELGKGAYETIRLTLEDMAMMLGDIAPMEIEEEPRITGDTIVMIIDEPIDPVELEVVEIEEPEMMLTGSIAPYFVEEVPIEEIPVEVVEIEEITEDLTTDKGAAGADVEIEMTDMRIKVKPVPARTTVTVVVESSENSAPLELMLFDQHGKLLRTGVLEGAVGSTAVLRVDDLPAGLYYLKGLREDYVFDQKILKM